MEPQRASHAAEHIRALKADRRVQRRREILQHEVGSHLFNCLVEPAPPRRGDTSKMAAALAAHLRALAARHAQAPERAGWQLAKVY